MEPKTMEATQAKSDLPGRKKYESIRVSVNKPLVEHAYGLYGGRDRFMNDSDFVSFLAREAAEEKEDSPYWMNYLVPGKDQDNLRSPAFHLKAKYSIEIPSDVKRQCEATLEAAFNEIGKKIVEARQGVRNGG